MTTKTKTGYRLACLLYNAGILDGVIASTEAHMAGDMANGDIGEEDAPKVEAANTWARRMRRLARGEQS